MTRTSRCSRPAPSTRPGSSRGCCMEGTVALSARALAALLPRAAAPRSSSATTPRRRRQYPGPPGQCAVKSSRLGRLGPYASGHAASSLRSSFGTMGFYLPLGGAAVTGCCLLHSRLPAATYCGPARLGRVTADRVQAAGQHRAGSREPLQRERARRRRALHTGPRPTRTQPHPIPRHLQLRARGTVRHG